MDDFKNGLCHRINERIKTRGFCVVYDHDLSRLCAPEAALRWKQIRVIEKFAADHGFAVCIREVGINATFKNAPPQALGKARRGAKRRGQTLPSVPSLASSTGMRSITSRIGGLAIDLESIATVNLPPKHIVTILVFTEGEDPKWHTFILTEGEPATVDDVLPLDYDATIDGKYWRRADVAGTGPPDFPAEDAAGGKTAPYLLPISSLKA